MICSVCGGTEVFIEEGIEYCRECNSQILGSRDEESSDESFSKKSLLSSPASTKKTKDKKKLFTPWLSIEAYNLILTKQISALISLGCSDKLKTVVLYIWAKYLQQIEVAFQTENSSDDNTPHLSAFPVRRDVQLLYGDGNARKRRKNIKVSTKSKSNESNTEEKNENDESDNSCQSSIKMQGFETDSTDSDSNEIESSNKPKKKELKYSRHAEKAKMKLTTKGLNFKVKDASVHHMTLLKTLSFCHLGLLYTEDQMQLIDLIRLTDEGRIPYIDITSLFPSSMQLQDDYYFHKNTTPDMKSIASISMKLIQFLSLPKFKHPSLLPIAVRFIKDLNLPNHLIPAVKVLIHKFEAKRGEWCVVKKQYRYHAVPLYEVEAMCFIVTTLKMLLVFDGQFENEHDDVMKKLNATLKGDQFFIWGEWKKQMALKEYLFLKSGPSYLDMNRLDSLCADRIINDYPHPTLRPDLYELADQEYQAEFKARMEFKSLLEPLFLQTPFRCQPTSFPLKQQLYRFRTEWENLQLYKETKQIDFDFLSKDFSKHKLCYRSTDSTDTDDICHILFSSLYEQEYVPTYNRSDVNKLFRTSRNYWFINYHLKQIDADYQRKWLEDLPISFKWLLKLSCKYLQISQNDFYMELKSLEYKSISKS